MSHPNGPVGRNHPAAPPPPAPPQRRKWPFIVGGVATLLVVIGVVNGAGAGATSAQPSGRDLSTATPSPSPAPALTDEDRFYATVQTNAPQFVPRVTRTNLVDVGHKVCDAIGTPGVTYEVMVSYMGTTWWGPDASEVVVDAAHQQLCSDKTYAVATVVNTPPAQPAGPQTTITGDGTYVVGEDIEPGRYKASGSAQDSGAPCYWARLSGDGGDIIDNGLQDGPQTVTVKAGELFETSRCGTWTKR
jgi:hypothetical protein